MKIEKTKDLTYYESLPYTVTVRKDEDGGFVARIQELTGCLAHGETEASAIQNLHSMQRLWIEDALSSGDDVPEPEDEASLPSGKWLQRVPRRLHRDLVSMAKRDNISLNQLVTSMLSEAFAVKSCTDAFQVVLSRVPIHPVDYGATMWGWGGRFTANPWLTTPHVQGDSVQALARISKIKPKYAPLDPPIFADAYADPHPEREKQLAGK